MVVENGRGHAGGRWENADGRDGAKDKGSGDGGAGGVYGTHKNASIGHDPLW